MLQLKDYENMAQQIGAEFVASPETASLNSLAVKVAESASLNPEGIRTVVRLANVIVFEKQFEKKGQDGSEDRRVQFELGDPEVVIAKLTEKVAAVIPMSFSTPATYDALTDYNADLPKVSPSSMQKTAGVAEAPPKSLPPKVLEYKTKIAAGRLKADKEQAEVAWSSALEKAARCLMVDVSTTSERVDFEKNALASLGKDCQTELVALNMLTSPERKATNVFGGEKVAEVLNTYVGRENPKHMRAMSFIKVAHEARLTYERYAEGLAKLNQVTFGA